MSLHPGATSVARSYTRVRSRHIRGRLKTLTAAERPRMRSKKRKRNAAKTRRPSVYT